MKEAIEADAEALKAKAMEDELEQASMEVNQSDNDGGGDHLQVGKDGSEHGGMPEGDNDDDHFEKLMAKMTSRRKPVSSSSTSSHGPSSSTAFDAGPSTSTAFLWNKGELPSFGTAPVFPKYTKERTKPSTLRTSQSTILYNSSSEGEYNF